MKILQLSFIDISLNTGGAQALRRNHTMLCSTFGKENVAIKKIELCKKDTTVRRLKKLTKQVISNSYFENENECINQAMNVDMVFIDSSINGGIAKKLRHKGYKGLIITFFHNCEYFLCSEERKGRLSLTQILFKHNIRQNEKSALIYSDLCLFICQRDCKTIVSEYGINLKHSAILPMTLPDSYSKEYEFLKDSNKHDKPIYTFIGSYFYPNIFAVKWFAKEVLPHVDIHFRVIGKGMDKLRQELPDSVELLSDVPDICPYIIESDYMLYPIFHGSGMKVKTCEALMYGKNIIGSTEAFNGYDVEFDKVGALCNTPNEFITSICKLHMPRYNSYSRQIFLKKYSIESTIKEFNEIINDLNGTKNKL